MKRRIVYHYTYGHSFEDIIESGVLLPPCQVPNQGDNLAAGIAPYLDRAFAANERLLLFSQRTDWEPASYRGVVTDKGLVDLLAIEDYAPQGWSVYRIGVERHLLRPWGALKRLVSLPHGMGRALESTAQDIGSNPFDWWGTTRPVPSDKWVSVEIYRPDTKDWMTYAEASAAVAA